MLTWRIGDVTVTRVVEMELPVPYSPKHSFLKEATPRGAQGDALADAAFRDAGRRADTFDPRALVEAPGLKLVVDTCVGNDKPRDMTGGQRAADATSCEHIAEAGFTRESVDAVVCTHLHVDHVGWNTMLEDAQVGADLPQRALPHRPARNTSTGAGRGRGADRRSWRLGHADLRRRPGADWWRWTTASRPRCGSMPTTGHTPGHVSVVIESKGETRGHHRRHDAPPLPDRSPGMVVRVRQRQGGGAARRASDAPRNGPTSRSSSSAPISPRRRPATSCATARATGSSREQGFLVVDRWTFYPRLRERTADGRRQAFAVRCR